MVRGAANPDGRPHIATPYDRQEAKVIQIKAIPVGQAR